MWAPDELRKVRLAELERVLPYLPSGSRVLEIGAGAGWQVQALRGRGFTVEAIEYAHSGFQQLAIHRVCDVVEYDGHHIPFPNNSFDVVFSSNVLEHIPHICLFQKEIRRVLKPDGVAIHIIPTASWRAWTTITHYIFVGKRFMSWIRPQPKTSNTGVLCNSTAGDTKKKALAERIVWLLVPERHGELGNFLTEMAYFSRWRWRRLFRDAGFHIYEERSNGIFYTGYSVLGGRLPVNARAKIAPIFGGSCRFWVLQPLSDRECA